MADAIRAAFAAIVVNQIGLDHIVKTIVVVEYGIESIGGNVAHEIAEILMRHHVGCRHAANGHGRFRKA